MRACCSGAPSCTRKASTKAAWLSASSVAAWRAANARISHAESRPSRAIALSAAAENLGFIVCAGVKRLGPWRSSLPKAKTPERAPLRASSESGRVVCVSVYVCVDRCQFRTATRTNATTHTRSHATHEHVARRLVLACPRTKSDLAHAPPSKHRPCTRASPSTSQPCSSAQTALCLFALANESAVAPVLALVFLFAPASTPVC